VLEPVTRFDGLVCRSNMMRLVKIFWKQARMWKR